ncbi:putative porin [Maribellus comscasis]|nr:putative porin [Maribellus comscasis]
MRKQINKYLLFVIIAFLPVLVFSQRPSELMNDEESQPGKPQKEIKPEIKLWQLSGYGAFQDSSKLDTMLKDFRLYHPVYKNSITATYLGNYGLPYLDNNFFERKPGIDFFFLRTREAYLLTPSKLKYYNTRTPYTVLDYSQSENKSRKSEARFNVLHTQNVNPYLNLTFRYDQARSDGQYNYQDSKNNLVSLYSNYNKDELKIHAGFIANSIQNSENGGLEADSLLLSDRETEYLNVNLNSTRSKFTNTYFFATGEYRFGRHIKVDTIPASEEPFPEDEEGAAPVPPSEIFKPIVGLMYSVEYQRHYKQFTDEEDTTNTFFPNTYFGDDYVKDSIRFNKISNVFQIKQYENPDRKTSFGKRAFIGQEFVKVTHPGPIPDVYNRPQVSKYSNVYLGGGIFRQTGNFWQWNAEGKFYVVGRNIGQTEISGIISKPLRLFNDSLAAFKVRGAIENTVPDYFQEEFYSNHSKWDNNLDMEQSMTIEGSFEMPKRRLKLGANYALINNYIYNDTLGIPAQTNEELLVVAAYIDKDFSARNLHLRTRLLYQKVSNEKYIHLPDFSAFVSAYYQFVISKVLYTQLGVDTRYYTSFYSDAYDPSTGLFYLQNEKKTGNFPYIDAYATLRLKRTRFFFKMINIGTSFIEREYFTTPHYPMNRMTFRFGVAWSFYD